MHGWKRKCVYEVFPPTGKCHLLNLHLNGPWFFQIARRRLMPVCLSHQEVSVCLSVSSGVFLSHQELSVYLIRYLSVCPLSTFTTITHPAINTSSSSQLLYCMCTCSLYFVLTSLKQSIVFKQHSVWCHFISTCLDLLLRAVLIVVLTTNPMHPDVFEEGE